MFPIAAGLVRSTGGRPSSWAATGRSGGVSRPPFDSLNLAGYVGDDGDDVAGQPSAARGSGRCVGGPCSGHGRRPRGVRSRSVAGPGVVAGVDGLVTQEPGLAILALGADCVPLGLVGDDGRTIGVAHCGWRGLVVDVVGSILSVLHDHGCGVAFAVLGPAVCGACYPVPPERADEVAGHCSAAVRAAALATCADGQPGDRCARGSASPAARARSAGSRDHVGRRLHRRGPRPLLVSPGRHHRSSGHRRLPGWRRGRRSCEDGILMTAQDDRRSST